MTGRGGARPTARPRRRIPASPAAPTGKADFPIVAIGASAGGLGAFRTLFEALPVTSGMAFVVVQHLDPSHDSMLVDLLADHTEMTVQEVVDETRPEPDQVYVIPPGAYLSIRDGALRLSSPRERHGARMPFDFFLRSLAEECGARAICAILSGTGADGSLGLTAVKEKGGLVLVQDPAEAAFDGMPRSAIATGATDRVVTLAQMAETLASHSRQPYSKREAAPRSRDGTTEDALAEIIELLRAQTSHTFALYKQGTLLRRIERRMAMAAIGNIDRYLEMLRQDPRELETLGKDLLINVTSFFRDAKAFALLADTIIPELVRRQPPGQLLRIWVAGCSTGEETYSLTMLLLEEIETARRNTKLQVFASDIDVDAVSFARHGLYPDTIKADVPPARLARFFAAEDHGYRVGREVREAVVFTVQDLLADPPFSRLDLVSCRNLLIYLQPAVQERVLSLFHFALREHGFLFLGSSETVGSLGERFEPISKKHRIYRRIGRGRPGNVAFPVADSDGARPAWPRAAPQKPPLPPSRGELAQRLLLEAYAPASVLVNRSHEGLYYFGATDRFLRVAPGDASRDLLGMVRDGLRTKLRSAIQQATREHVRVQVTGARLSDRGGSGGVSIAVQPVQSDGEELLLVSFLDEPERDQKPKATDGATAEASRIAELEQQLEATNRELQGAIRDFEISNEELKAINEEAQSVNEEFQSANEELETSKEELQSLNEELTALNGQLQETVESQRATANDLQNILHSSDLATLFLDEELNIRFFTPAATSLFSVIASDIGRPLSDLTRRFADRDLIADARAVLASRAPLQREIRTDAGAWYVQRTLPYRSHDDRVEGVVLTFAEISEVKTAEAKIENARAYADSVIDTIRQPLVVLDGERQIISANRSFYRAFALSPEATVGQKIATIGGFDAPAFGAFFDRIQAGEEAIEDFSAEIELPRLGRRTLLLNARTVREMSQQSRKILVAIDDITERKRVDDAVAAARHQAEQANLGKSRFLAAASHDLRQPLQTISLLQGVLARKLKDEAALKLVARLDETVNAMSGMLNTLLDINQLEAGIVHPELLVFPISGILEQLSSEFGYHAQVLGLRWTIVQSRLAVRTDPRLLEQMLRNLLSNAMKYTAQGRILLGCRRRGDKLRIEVWDTGIGIPEGQLRAIFDEFHQIDNSARERSRGLGLGLAIVQRLSDLLDHPVDVRSRLGRGSVFAVEVPFERGDAPASSGRRQGPPSESAGRSGAILLVDDDPAIREMLDLLLADEGHRTAAAAQGRDALSLVTSGAICPDILIADYNLPGGQNGLDVAAELRKTLGREIPVIILTGDISTEALREIARHGCIQRNKPAQPGELLQLIERLLSTVPQKARPSNSRQPAASTGSARLPTIFVIDDDSAVREAIGEFLQAEGRPVEAFASCEAFLAAHGTGRGGCLVLDARLPGMSGLALLERLKQEGNGPPAVMITGHGDVATAVRAMEAGASGFIEKPVRPEILLASIDRALEQTLDAAALIARREEAAARVGRLTRREREIMDLVIVGNPNKEIAALLGINQRTVENHRAAVMRKTGSGSLADLIHLEFAGRRAVPTA